MHSLLKLHIEGKGGRGKMEREYNDLIGDILESTGDKDRVKGKGEPLSKSYMKRDVYQNFQKVARDSGFLPHWLKLQKEIAELISKCDTEDDVEIINSKIKKYNSICPTPLQRGMIRLNNLDKAKEIW